MIDPNDEALLNARLDGALDPIDRARVEALLGASDEARRRGSELEMLARTLGELDSVEPPPEIVPTVMARVQAMAGRDADTQATARTEAGARVVRLPIGNRNGGMVMARKAMVGLAAAAAIVLGILAYRGFPPVKGTEATIGAAKRAQAPQMTQGSVVLGDADAQAFVQSDVFDRLVKDPNTRKLLGSADFRSFVADASMRGALASSEMRSLLQRSSYRDALADSSLREAFSRPAVSSALGDAAARGAFASDAFKQAISAADYQSALTKLQGMACCDSRLFQAAIADSALMSAFAKSNVREMFADSSFYAALSQPAIMGALRQSALWSAMADANLSSALAGSAFQDALQKAGFESAMRSQMIESALNRQ
jgi:anti-sigma factor RsiW